MYDKESMALFVFSLHFVSPVPAAFFWRQETRENCAKSGTSRTKRITSYHTSGTEVGPLLKAWFRNCLPTPTWLFFYIWGSFPF